MNNKDIGSLTGKEYWEICKYLKNYLRCTDLCTTETTPDVIKEIRKLDRKRLVQLITKMEKRMDEFPDHRLGGCGRC